MKIFLASITLFFSSSLVTMQKSEKDHDKAEKLIEKIAEVPFKPPYVSVPSLSPEERKLRAEESDRRFKEQMKIEKGREIAQNICPIIITQEDNPELFTLLPDNDTKIKRFYDTKNRLFSLEIIHDDAVLINHDTGARIVLNEPTEKVFSSHIDQRSNQLLLFKNIKNAEREFGKHTTLIEKIDVATGTKISQTQAKMPYQINKIAYDADTKRIYVANFMMSCFGGDAASLYTLNETDDQANHVESFSLSKCFYHLFPLKGDKLITVQEEGMIKEWDFSQPNHPSTSLLSYPIDCRFEAILPGNAIHADLSVDEKELLVATCQPYSRFFLLNLEQTRMEQQKIRAKRMLGQEAEPRSHFAHDILDIDDPRPTTAIKLLPNKINFLAVRQALKKRVPLWLRKEKEDPVDFTVQLWSFSKAMYEKNAPLAEFTVTNSPRKCLELGLSADSTKVIANNIIWNIGLLTRAKELCVKDLLKTAQEFEAMEAQDAPETPKASSNREQLSDDDEEIFLLPVPSLEPKKQYSARKRLELLKRLEALYAGMPNTPARDPLAAPAIDIENED